MAIFCLGLYFLQSCEFLLLPRTRALRNLNSGVLFSATRDKMISLTEFNHLINEKLTKNNVFLNISKVKVHFMF